MKIKKIIILIIVYFLYTGIVYAEVSQFVFTNESRMVAPGVISEPLTIQSQNSSGTQESVTETTDLLFQSSSPTGQFLNSSGNPVSTTMSKNTANRTFYYRDATTGTHTITVTATGRDTKNSFTATQGILVGTTSTNDQVSNSTPTSTSTTTSTSANTSTPNTVEISTHSSPSPAYSSRDVVSFEVSAGRKRFSSVGGEVVFKAEPVKLTGVPDIYIQYQWSFGDGTTAQGQTVSHRYKFPGEYVVVLNATYGDKSAVSRTEVMVIKPTFTIEPVSGGINVTNQSIGEVNLGEWSIEGAHARLDIPRDTIIQKGKSIIFSYDVLVNTDDLLMLKQPLGVVVAEYRPVENVATKVVTTDLVVVREEPKIKIVRTVKPVPKKEIISKTTLEIKKETPSETKEVNPNDLVATVYTASPKSSAFDSLLWIPRKGWGILEGLFR